MTRERILMDLPWNASAPRCARKALRAWGANPEANVVVSELVTNALQHGEPPISLVTERTAEIFRIGVCDKRHDLGAVSRDSVGLRIVEALSRSWGVEQVKHNGKCVWAEFPA
jgi:anti-sigma regulatory factor (Ser/Thr protein kinase)